jgi:hypothetical protein
VPARPAERSGARLYDRSNKARPRRISISNKPKSQTVPPDASESVSATSHQYHGGRELLYITH